jgi:hypothetical protein
VATKPCLQAAAGEEFVCYGYYLYEYKTHQLQRKVPVALPPPMVWVTLSDCVYSNSTYICDDLPTLILTGEEPLVYEHITGLTVFVNGQGYTCDPVCEIELGPTDPAGVYLSFWASSSYGDTSVIFDALVRVAQGTNGDPADIKWYVDVLSSQWRGAPAAGCATTWDLFPPVGGPPRWLSTPDSAEELASSIPYDYLAGNLIAQGKVDASDCLDNGLLPSGAASECGIEAARPEMTAWQNQFDDLIFAVAWDTGIPAQLLKNLFSLESQFWPGNFSTKADIGLGQLTENGADTTLLWNPAFFEQFCPLLLDDNTCRKGYSFLKTSEQDTLRGALVHSVDAACAGCLLGIDLNRADTSVGVFSQTLLANCEQAAYIITDVSGVPTSEISTYEDMWRFTLLNYNAGPGCLILALQDTMDSGEPLEWGYVVNYLTPVCQGAADYVADISR